MKSEIEILKDIFGSLSKAVEILLVLKNKKQCARMGFYDEELQGINEYCKNNNLFIEFSDFKVTLNEKEDDAYSNKGTISDSGMIFAYISTDKETAKMAKYHESRMDHLNLGKLLGYPTCCISFFIENEEYVKNLDNDYTPQTMKYSIGSPFPYQNNILLREKDTSLISHFPCGFHCQESASIGQNTIEEIQKIDGIYAESVKNSLIGRFAYLGEDLEFS